MHLLLLMVLSLKGDPPPPILAGWESVPGFLERVFIVTDAVYMKMKKVLIKR